MKSFLPALTLMVFVLLSSFSEGSKHIREVFHESVKSESKLDNLIKSTDYPKSDVTTAYKGLAKCTSADFATWPTTKWTYFKEGKALIEKAVANSPKNPEIAYIRFMVQANAPSIVDYNDNIDQDIAVFRDNIKSYDVSESWKQRFKTQMASSAYISANQKTTIKNISIK